MNACFIDEMVVENPHDAVQELIERYGKNTHFENGSSPNTEYAQSKSDDEEVVMLEVAQCLQQPKMTPYTASKRKRNKI